MLARTIEAIHTPQNLDDYVLPLDALVRAVEVNRGVRHALFLGAGASIISGIQSADGCIWEWKPNLFLTQNPSLHAHVQDYSLPSVQTKLQAWLDSQAGSPPAGSSEEYGYYAERAFPIAEDRRQYFQQLVEKAKPFVGYQLVCLLAEAGILGSVWTTNFDSLVPRAAASSSLTTIEVGRDTLSRANRQARSGELVHVSLHGDYRYDALKNTPIELAQQDRELRDRLARELTDTNLVVVGYSGRDDSIQRSS